MKITLDYDINLFELSYVRAEDFKGILVINHRDNFLESYPEAYRHMNAYSVYRKGDEYSAEHRYAAKIPDFGELLEAVAMYRSRVFGFDYDERVSIAIDWDESPRFTDYTRCIMYGLCYRPAKNEIEIYNEHRTIEIFHEWMQKSSHIRTDWDRFRSKNRNAVKKDEGEEDGEALVAMAPVAGMGV